MKKILTVLLAGVLLFSGGVFAFAADGGQDSPKADARAIGSFSGFVQEVRDFYEQDGNAVANKKFVLVKNEEGTLYNFLVDERTAFVTGEGLSAIREGDRFTGYYDANLPMILIYPPQANAIAAVVNPSLDDYAVKVAWFDEELVSSDNQLKLNMDGAVSAVDEKGNAWIGSITDQYLAVVYQVSTKSIPARTTPSQVIVLDYQGQQQIPGNAGDGETGTEGGLIVNGRTLDTPAWYRNSSDVVMVPLRAAAEALGYTVDWDNGSVLLNAHVSLQIGTDAYSFARMAPITLGTAPELRDGHTCVPLAFFQNVLRLENVQVQDGNVILQ